MRAAAEEDVAPLALATTVAATRRSPSVAVQLAVDAERRARRRCCAVERELPGAAGQRATSTSRIVSPWRKLIRRCALPLSRQPSSERHGESGVGARPRGRCRAAARVALELGERGEQPDVVGRLRRPAGTARLLALDQRGVEVGVGERRRRDQAAEELDVVGDADDRGTAPAPARMRASAAGAVGAVDDQLGDHRVVERRDRVALLDAGVDAHVRRSRPAARGARACRSTAGSRVSGSSA